MNLFHSLTIRQVLIALSMGIGVWCIAACNTEKELITNTHKTNGMSVEKPEFYLKHRLLYQTLSGRGDVRLVMDGQKQKLSFKVDMNKGQDLLASIRALGLLEVGRAYATPDSVFALNRLNKTAYALDYQEGIQLLQAEVPFAALQDLFAGNSLLPVDAPISGMELTKDSCIAITQQKDNFIQTLQYNLSSLKLSHLELKATDRLFHCVIDYSNYQKIGIGQSFAYNREIRINNNGKDISVTLSFTQTHIDQPVNTNFTIPNSYTVKRGYHGN